MANQNPEALVRDAALRPGRGSSLKLLAASGWVVVARVVGAVAFAASNALLARSLGADEFGYFTVIFSVSVAAGFVAAAGMNRSLLKQIAVHEELGGMVELAAYQRYASRILAVSVPVVGIVTGVAIYLVGVAQGESRTLLGAATAALVMLSGMQLVVADGLRAYGRRIAASFLEGRSGGAASFVVLTVMLLPFIGHTFGVSTAICICVAASGVVLPIWWLMLRPRWTEVMREADDSTQQPPLNWKRPFVIMSVAFVGTQLLAFASNQGDLWIVAGIVPGHDLSLFAAAFRLITVVATPLLALQLTLTPTVAALYGGGKLGELESVARRAATLAAIPAVLSVAVIAAEPSALLGGIFGSGFSDGAPILLWLALGQVVNALSGIGGQILTMSGYQRDVLVISTIALVLKLAIGIPIAEMFGVVWYAAITSVTTAAMNVAFVASVRHRMGIWILPTFRSVRARPA